MASTKECQTETKQELHDLTPFDPTKKKKKKKITPQELANEYVDPVENLTISKGDETSFAGLKKKKKKPVDPKLFVDVAEGGEDKDDEIGEDESGDANDEQSLPSLFPWERTDRNYLYEELLRRVFNVLRENNPELAGDRRRTVLSLPQVMREGTKKTVFANFANLCYMMRRQPDHVMSFLLPELGTSGSLDGQQRLVVKGRFAPKNFEGILRRYLNEYVICNGCKSSDTSLLRENRINFLRCGQCGSNRSVFSIKYRYVARVGRRNAA